MDPELKEFIDLRRPAVESRLASILPAEETPPASLHKAMRYAALSPGKRLRPMLCLLGCRAVGADPFLALDLGCAFELVHAYSLVHDDLPAMDDAELRRGRPTAHKVFGEALALLAGDALLTLAFEVMAAAGPAGKGALFARELARAAGSLGMVGGQTFDLEMTGKASAESELERLHAMKTGAIIRAAVVTGGIAGGASERQAAALADFGRLAGLAFQVADDILDVESTPELLGKGTGADQAAGKTTYPGLLGLEGAKAKARSLAGEAKAAAAKLPSGRLLAALADHFVERTS